MAFCALSASAFKIPIQMECSEEACVMKITLIFSFDNTSNNRLDEPETPIIPEPSKVSNAMPSI